MYEIDYGLKDKMNFNELYEFYYEHLTKNIVPFWTKYCIDSKSGGINNIVEDDGTVISTDRFMWSQGRALWTFSALYNYIQKRKEWLDAAEGLYKFIIRKGRDDKGRWAFKVDVDGNILIGAESIYVDAFIIHGMTEYYKVSKDENALKTALNIYENTKDKLYDHAKLKTSPHHIPKGFQSHGIFMIFANAYYDLFCISNDDEMLKKAVELADVIFTQHLDKEDKILYEFVRPGGEKDKSDTGKTFLPGHVIESMWFLDRIYRKAGMNEKAEICIQAIRWHLEKGWDNEYGGLFLACHKDGGKPVWHQPDAKVWWPFTEALYALLMAYDRTGEEWCLKWYKKVHEYSFKHFPDTEHGEWHQNLDRKGRIVPVVIKELSVKDPFHLPRALIYSLKVLDKLKSIK